MSEEREPRLVEADRLDEDAGLHEIQRRVHEQKVTEHKQIAISNRTRAVELRQALLAEARAEPGQAYWVTPSCCTCLVFKGYGVFCGTPKPCLDRHEWIPNTDLLTPVPPSRAEDVLARVKQHFEDVLAISMYFRDEILHIIAEEEARPPVKIEEPTELCPGCAADPKPEETYPHDCPVMGRGVRAASR